MNKHTCYNCKTEYTYNNIPKGTLVFCPKCNASYNPWQGYPKGIKIQVPKSSPTFDIKELDKSLDKIFEKKEKK